MRVEKKNVEAYHHELMGQKSGLIPIPQHNHQRPKINDDVRGVTFCNGGNQVARGLKSPPFSKDECQAHDSIFDDVIKERERLVKVYEVEFCDKCLELDPDVMHDESPEPYHDGCGGDILVIRSCSKEEIVRKCKSLTAERQKKSRKAHGINCRCAVCEGYEQKGEKDVSSELEKLSVRLYEKAYSNLSTEEQAVVLMKTAKKFGYNYLGFEINPQYVEIANKRLEQTQLSLPPSPKGEGILEEIL